MTTDHSQVKFHRYIDRRGWTISVRVVQDREGRWVEDWTTAQVVAAGKTRVVDLLDD